MGRVEDVQNEADTTTSLSAIASDPRYRKLLASRSRLGWQLAGIMLAVFFGFILVIAFRKDLLAEPIGQATTTWGIPVGLGVILVGIALTGFYVFRANRDFDPLLEAIRKDAAK
ncbi:DUF485 domain-containing protein [Novosphingobium aerophilum]